MSFGADGFAWLDHDNPRGPRVRVRRHVSLAGENVRLELAESDPVDGAASDPVEAPLVEARTRTVEAPLVTRFRARLERLLARLERELPDRDAVATLGATEWRDRMADLGRDRLAALSVASAYAVGDARMAGRPAPLAVTVGEALELFRDELDSLARLAALDLGLEAAFVVDPDALEAVLARSWLVDRWPIPLADRSHETGPEDPCLAVNDGEESRPWPGGWPAHLLLARAPSRTEDLLAGAWPSLRPTTEDVSEWARGRHRGSWFSITGAAPLVPVGDKGEAVQPGWALLYQAEEQVRELKPSRPTLFLADTTRPTLHATSVMGGADPSHVATGGVSMSQDEGPTVTSMRFGWTNGEAEQLELSVDNDPDNPNGAESPFVRIARRYGPLAVRCLFLTKALMWTRRARATEAVWTWPDELLELAGLKDTRENRKTLGQRLDALNGATLAVRYAGAPAPVSAPILGTVARSGHARLLLLHPSFYAGVRRENGQLGTRWWPFDLEAVRGRADRAGEGRAFILMSLVATLGRLRLNDGAVRPIRIRACLVTDWLGIRGDKRHELDGRTARTLRDTLEAGKPHVLSGWEADGKLEAPGTVLTLEVAKLAQEIAGDRAKLGRDKPHPLPGTGEELAEWLTGRGLSAAEGGRLLGVDPSTLQRAARTGPTPLTPRVRGAFRRALWGRA